jgi:HPt (histidine-containing phosphotransfer) domain-containing protein
MLEQIRDVDREGAGLLADLVSLFRTSAGLHLSSLDGGVTDRDRDAIGRAAHALRGSSANLGATEVVARAGELEQRLAGGDIDDTVVALAADLRRAVVRALEALEEEVAAAVPPPGGPAHAGAAGVTGA